MNIEVIARWKIKESETSRIMEILPELVKKSRLEQGNIFYEVYQSQADPNEFILHEKYKDSDSAESHRDSEHYQSIVVNAIVPHLTVREVTRVTKLL